MSTTDRLLAAGLAAATLATRLPFRARLLPSWDAVQFALALTDYDVARHQPHPPGYILFVAAARGLGYLVGADALGALTLLAALASALTVGLVYRLAWRLYDRPTAILSALVLATSPLFWVHGAVPLSYAAEAALAAAVASLAWELREGRRSTLWASALVLGLAGGVRQSILIVLLPLWLQAAWAGFRRWRPFLGALALLAGTVLAWLVPMVWLTGGVQRYVEAGVELYGSTVRATTVLDPSGRWQDNVVGVGEGLIAGLGLFLPLVLWIAGRPLFRGWGRLGPRASLFALWVVPPLLVYALVHLGQPGYLLTVLPALAILAARGVVLAARGAPAPSRPLGIGESSGSGATRRSLRLAGVGAVAAGVLAAHAAFFVVAGPVDVRFPATDAPWPTRLDARLRALYRFSLWANTAGGLREREDVIATYVSAVKTGFDPSDTILVTEQGNRRSYAWFRHVTYYLPGFRVYHLRLEDPVPRYLVTPEPGPGVTPDPRTLVLPASARRLVWVVDYWNPAAARPPGLVARPLAHGRWLFVLPVGRRPLEYAGFEIGRSTTLARPRRGVGDPGLAVGRGRTGA